MGQRQDAYQEVLDRIEAIKDGHRDSNYQAEFKTLLLTEAIY